MFTTRNLELVNYQDRLFYVYRKVNKNRIKEGHINDIKEFWHCDLVLKNKNQDDDTLLFLIEIPEAQIVVESIENPS